MRVGIIGAMTQEIDHLIPEIKNKEVVNVGNRKFISGNILHHKVVVVFSRWGKVAAASTATTLINLFKSEMLIFTGVAGAINESLNIGDIIVGNSFVQHDMDASALPGIKKFEIPLLGLQFLNPAADLVEKALKASDQYLNIDLPKEISLEKLKEFGISKPRVVSGLVGSGDQFIASSDTSMNLRSVLPEILCTEMEGAAVAQVSVEYDIPFIILRTISDKADHSAHIDFQKFVDQIASHFTCGSVMRFLEMIKE